MDPLAHTLIGASLAETRLGRCTPLAMPALLIGVNLPDLDAVAMLIDGDLALGVRRGWTHGALAMLVLPAVLAITLMLADRGLRRRRPDTAPASFTRLALLAYLAVWTHPLLDWLNTYGIRLLMPFDERWFYGDALFIVDPWLWLLAATPSVLARNRTRAGIGAWTTLALATSWLVLSTSVVPASARLLWIVGVLAIAGLRAWDGWRDHTHRVAGVSLTLIGVYMATMLVGSRIAATRADAWLRERGVQALEIMAGPVPADPFRREIIAAEPDRYRLLELDSWSGGEVRERAPALARGPNDAVVAAALEAPHVRGLVTWLRFPSYVVETTPDGYRVIIQDARRAGRAGIGLGVVELDSALNVR